MQIGDRARLTRAFDQAAVKAFVALGGGAAQDSRVSEPLPGALFSTLLGMHLPGAGARLIEYGPLDPP